MGPSGPGHLARIFLACPEPLSIWSSADRLIVATAVGIRKPGRGPNPTRAEGDTTMRFMILIKADKNSEAGVMPSEKLLAEMGTFNEELVKAGIMLAGEGLHPSSKGARVEFSGAKRMVTDGPFAETKELIAGFWIWKCRSMQEAIDWVNLTTSALRRGRIASRFSTRLRRVSLSEPSSLQ